MLPHRFFAYGFLIARYEWHQFAFAEGPWQKLSKIFDIFKAIHGFHVKSGAKCPASPGAGSLCAPHRIGHEMIAQNKNTAAAHGADCMLVVFDLLVSPRQTKHGLVVKVHRNILNGFKSQPGFLYLANKPGNVVLFPTCIPRQLRRVHLDP